MESKKKAAESAVEYICDGMIVGLGTGSTVYWAIQKIGKRVKEGLNIKAITTSIETENLAKNLGINIVSFSKFDEIDLTIDGADEIDRDWNLLKGGGGALLREKIVANASKELIIVSNENKLVSHLGQKPLPVETVKFGFEVTMKQLKKLGCIPKLRMYNNNPFITDNENFIVDCYFENIDQPEELNNRINMIPGVVENGLFLKLAKKVIVGYKDGAVYTFNM